MYKEDKVFFFLQLKYHVNISKNAWPLHVLIIITTSVINRLSKITSTERLSKVVSIFVHRNNCNCKSANILASKALIFYGRLPLSPNLI